MCSRHFVIMTTWSCQSGRYISIGIVEAERAVTVQIMRNGRSLMLACFFTIAENRDIWGENGKRGIHVWDARMRERDVCDPRVFAFLFLPQTAATSTIYVLQSITNIRQWGNHLFHIQTNISSQTFNPPTRCLMLKGPNLLDPYGSSF